MMRRASATGLVALVALQAITACGDDDLSWSSPPNNASAGQTSIDEAGAGGREEADGGAGSVGQGGAAGEPTQVEPGGAGSSGEGGASNCSAADDCDDGNVCTDDDCNAGECTHTNNIASCNDENECTDHDACVGGACQGKNNAIECDDLSSCTHSDKCGNGACNGAKDLALCPVCAAGNLLQNCDFADGDTAWLEDFVDGSGLQQVQNERLIVDVESSGVEAYDVAPRQEGLTLQRGMKYRLRLVAGASVERSIVVALKHGAAPYLTYPFGDAADGGFTLNLSEQMQPFERTFVMREPTDASAALLLGLGGAVGNPSRVYFDDVYLAEQKCGSNGDCDDGNTCTNDVCDLSSGACAWINSGAACADDGNACTQDACVAGQCTHAPRPDFSACTNDGDACTADECLSGLCRNTFDTAICACKLDAHCDDSNPCTNDVCNAGACEYTENSASCDDHNECTSNDVCSGGLCAGTNNTHECEDGDVCTVADVCSAGVCESGASACYDCTAAANLLVNCNLTSGYAGWQSGFFGAATGQQRVEKGMLVVDIVNGGVKREDVQTWQAGLLLKQGTTYSVELNARASTARSMVVAVTQDGGAIKSYSGDQRFELDRQMKRLRFEFTMNDAPPSERAKFAVRLGGEPDNPTPNTVWLDNLSVVAK
ncbi:MAG TPA: carbohydrate binding domain-containing protein [Polyangiaceae bacterium]|nr:carbohydrate binding domain-containing protein [Polyangiaceae bacterium]